ncbi:MAG TPA: potassium channel protein [Bacteroidales bacterium]|jgi:voltage-gated potassium channel|nr:potassium channel protein [Bacteroidales bacterium]
MKNKGLGKENFRSIYVSIGLLMMSVILGTSGFILIEGFTFTEAFFMTIITISTVGFREVHPLSELGQFFTAFLIVISFGIFAYAVTTLTRYIVDGVFRNYLKDNKVKTKIAKLSNHVIVVGYGRNGKQAIEELQRHKFQVVVIDNVEAIIETIREDATMLYIQGDATQDEILLDAKIENAQALITALPNDADNLFVVLTARAMNPELKIISRASSFNSDRKLRSAGATNVIMPDKIGGQRMAKLVAQPDIVDFLEYIMLRELEEVYIDEISCKDISPVFAEKTIGEWSIRSETGANIIGIKTADNNYIVNPSPDVNITSNDQIFVLGNPEQIRKLKKVLYQSN